MKLVAWFGILGFLAGCASEVAEPADPSSSEPEIVSRSVEHLRAITPETRVAVRPIDAVLGPNIAPGRRVSAVRAFDLDGKPSRLVVDIDALVTSVVREEVLSGTTRPANAADAIGAAPYPKSLADVEARVRLDAEAPIPAGVNEPFALTVDMCQSRKPWEKRLFDWAAELSTRLGRPTPIGIAMTGGWAKAHAGELDAMLGYERRGEIAITWINHSSTHPLHCLNASCSKAEFLTASSVDFDEEVLGLERTLLARGLVPSPVFRFPGLVHDRARLEQLARLSLLPLDADAWIAKGQPIKPRSVVLVHGNGNEPEGIVGFLRAVSEPRRAAALTTGTSALVSPLWIAPARP